MVLTISNVQYVEIDNTLIGRITVNWTFIRKKVIKIRKVLKAVLFALLFFICAIIISIIVKTSICLLGLLIGEYFADLLFLIALLVYIGIFIYKEIL